MTLAEKLRYQTTASRTKGAKIEFQLGSSRLTQIATYALSLSSGERIRKADELESAFQQAASRALKQSPIALGKVATVLDRSRSSFGSREKKNRPLAITVAANYLLRAASNEYRAFWTFEENIEHDFFVVPRGQTGLASPMIDALAWNPDLLIVVSDGYENDPPNAADQIVRVYEKRLSGKMPEIVHMNPVFDSEHYAPKPLGASISTVGLRDAEDIPTMLGFARFVNGRASLSELEEYLARRMAFFLKRNQL